MSVEQPPPSRAEVAMARFAADQLSLGGRVAFEEFTDRSGRHGLDVLLCANSPAPGAQTASTLSLHRSTNLAGTGAQRHDVRVELVTVLDADDVDLVGGLLAACAFAALAEGVALEPGTVFRDVVAAVVGGDLPHLLLVEPGPLPRLQRYRLGPGDDGGEGLEVRWLLGVPVHDVEADLLAARGLDALETLLAEREVVPHDTRRAPVVDAPRA